VKKENINIIKTKKNTSQSIILKKFSKYLENKENIQVLEIRKIKNQLTECCSEIYDKILRCCNEKEYAELEEIRIELENNITARELLLSDIKILKQKLNSGGHCSGFSLLHCFHRLAGNAVDFFEKLEAISNWNEINVTEEEEIIFEELMGQVVFLQFYNCTPIAQNSGTVQKDTHKQFQEWIIKNSKEKNIILEQNSYRELCEILGAEIFQLNRFHGLSYSDDSFRDQIKAIPNDTVAMISTGNHVFSLCAITIEGKKGYLVYDSNKSNGEVLLTATQVEKLAFLYPRYDYFVNEPFSLSYFSHFKDLEKKKTFSITVLCDKEGLNLYKKSCMEKINLWRNNRNS
jgi:mannitol/fructose-specific phosphotransferase system IIA component (Ntr-type)